MGAEGIRQYLSHLAIQDNVSASTQNQVPGRELGRVEGTERAKRPQRVPTVLTPDEVRRVPSHITGVHHLMAGLLYGTGPRVMERVRLRVQGRRFRLRADYG